MKLKNLLPAILLSTVLLNYFNTSAQTWNVTGNAGTATTNYLGTSDGKDLKIKTNNSLRITVKSGGSVGIGTSTPSALLHVQKSSLTEVLVKSSAAGAQVTIDRAGNGYDAVTRYTQTGVPQWTTGLTVNAAGSPDYVIKNDITGIEAFSISGISNNANLRTGSFTLGTIGSTDVGTISQTGNNLILSTYTPTTASGFTPGNIIMANANSATFKAGNVGIGTTTATLGKLVVEGSMGNTIALFKRTSTGAGVAIIGDSPGIYFNMYYNSGQKSMTSGYGSQIYLDKVTGTMGLGVTTTSAAGAGNTLVSSNALLINSVGNVGINYYNGPSTLDVGLKAGTTATASFWGSNSGFASHFCVGPNEDTYIRGGQTFSNVIIADLTNNVGIGTSNPAYKLDVCGTMRAKEVRVATGWCDYVFADDYKLPSLSEVESFIKINRHLPEVTPGSVIEGEGLEVGKTAAQMIKKIEELTLYVIDLQKQVNELKKSNK